MLKNLMEDKKIDLDAPLISVRRFSAGAASPTAPASKRVDGDQPPPPPRRSSLPFYKSDLKSGPVRVPGVVPFVWEQTPGQPKNGPVPTSVGGKSLAVPKPPPGRTLKEKETDSSRPVKLGNSVRTRKAVTFASDSATAKSSDSAEDVPKIAQEMKVKKVEQEEKKAEEQSVSAADNHVKEEKEEDDEDDDDTFSDALDTLSRTESFFMNCSVSGVSGIPDAAKLSGSFSKDPQVRDFMMERFLPAAQAMACDSPQYTFRKGAALPWKAAKPVERVAVNDRTSRPAPLPFQNKPNYLPPYAKELEEEDSYDDDEEDEEYYGGAGHFPSKGCGLLPKFCLKSSFCLLNTVPGMKVRGRLPPQPRGRTGSPRIRNVHPISLSRVEDELSWEAVYRKKLGQTYQPQVVEVSNLRSESDSVTADGSSPYLHSATGGTSPYQNEGSPSSLQERKGSLGILIRESKSSKTDGSDAGEKDIGNCWEINHSSRMGSGSMSPALEKTLYIDSANRPGSLDSKSSSFNTVKDSRSIMSSDEVGTESRRMRESILAEAHEGDALPPEVSKVAVPVLPLPSERLNDGDLYGDNNPKHVDNDCNPMHLKNDLNPLQSLLPPPLPKSPSESWLSRTLPSVTSKNPAPQSLLGIQLQPRKQTLQASSVDVKQETSIRPSKPQRRQIRFAEVLAKPESPKSEI